MLACFRGTTMDTNTKKRIGTRLAWGSLIVFCFLVLGYIVMISSVPTLPKGAHDAGAASSLRMLYLANVAYAKNHPQQGYARKLKDLSQRSGNPEHGEDTEWMLDVVLAGGEKGGYKFTYSSQSTKGNSKLDVYQAYADPLVPGKTGKHHFFVDETSVIRMSDTGPANANSAAIQ